MVLCMDCSTCKMNVDKVFLVFVICSLRNGHGYLTTDWTLYMWASPGASEDPATIWANVASPYSQAVNRSMTEVRTSGDLAYRNTMINEWTANPPELLRVQYRNIMGYPLYGATFNVTGTTVSDWMNPSRLLYGSGSSADIKMSTAFTSYSTYMSFSDTSWGVQRYQAAAVRLSNGSRVFIVAVHPLREPVILPATRIEECRYSYNGDDPLYVNMTVTSGIFRDYCSAICRERNYPHGGIHINLCGCLNTPLTSGTLTLSDCNATCDGRPEETCGGVGGAPSVVINIVNTDVNADLLTGDKLEKSTHVIPAGEAIQIEYAYTSTMTGFNFSLAAPNGILHDLEVGITLIFRNELCSEADLNNMTIDQTFMITTQYGYRYLPLDALKVQCVFVYLYDPTSPALGPLSETLHLNVYDLPANTFALASYISVEAAWFVEPVTANSSDVCECECWVYNLLYGDSPYNNLTYEEIEEALANVTAQIEKELSVNKSELSSTIRKLTSAEDMRVSAVAVGYSLGVALLTVTFGAIILADLPKLIAGLHALSQSLQSRFLTSKPACPPVTELEPT